MKAFQKFVQLCLILVFTLTSMGFRVNIEECHGHQDKVISFSGSPDCCCDKASTGNKTKDNSCRDITCVVQGNIQSLDKTNAAQEQSAKNYKVVTANREFALLIKPALQEKIPNFTLPPHPSGRFISILHQQFII